MSTRPIEIESANFAEFIASQRICVIRFISDLGIGFNNFLQAQLENQYREKVRLGWMNLKSIDYNEKSFQKIIKTEFPKIGLTKSKSIYPGYYLFKEGKLIAYHPGTIDKSKVDPRVQGMTTLISAVAGLFTGIVEKDMWKGLETFLDTMEAPQAFKVYEFFRRILNEKSQSHSKQWQQKIFDEELDKAYKILGVTPESSDDEIKKAWKKLQLKYHPDRSLKDKENRTKIIAEINNAYDLIKKSRERNKK